MQGSRPRETFQHEILRSRHYILKFLARRGVVYRDSLNWSSKHLAWLRPLAAVRSPLAREDALVFREYLSLRDYKIGNSHCRHVLVQAAWSYRHRPQVGTHLKARQQGQPAAIVTHAWKAQHRLHKLCTYLACRKQPKIAAVAVARELVGFLWAVMRELPPTDPTTTTS